MDDLVAETVREIEEEQALNRKSAVSVFQSMLNQPALLSVSSANANFTGSSESFSEFTVNLPRPILKVDTIQLLNANIPECTQNIPDTACVFWYYRLNSYYGAVPNPLNLYMVRLLPSYYKPEFGLFDIEDTTFYGFNRTFSDYLDLEDELTNSCRSDLARDNINEIFEEDPTQPTVSQYFPELPFNPRDIEIKLNTQFNKFRMTGMNIKLPFISYLSPAISTNTNVQQFNVATTYALGAYVYWEFSGTNYLYRSAVAGNVGNYPFFASTFWTLTTGDIGYDALTVYDKGDYVTYSNIAFRSAVDNNVGNTPDVNEVDETYWIFVEYNDRWINNWNANEYYARGSMVYYPQTFSFWVANANNKSSFSPAASGYWSQFFRPAGNIYNLYLIAGYDDPNVAIRQGRQLKTWNPYAWFDGLTRNISTGVQYNGFPYLPSTGAPLPNTIPFPYPVTYQSSYYYLKGDLTLLSGNIYEALLPVNAISPPNSVYWTLRTDLSWSATKRYVTGDVVTRSGGWYIALKTSINQTPPTTAATGNTNEWWQTAYWQRNYASGTIEDIVTHVGLNDLSNEYDQLDVVEGDLRFPFPFGIPGQPFNPNPKRLLNSILGFTWNGLMDVSSLATFQVFNINVLTNNTLVQLYNRIRPVPEYLTAITTGLGLGVEPERQATLNPTFTANGYANLVYSSVVAIYGSIAGARTLDTQRNTSLLGMTSMNADNLGVSFYGNYIDTELIANEEDLYTISIQLFDEFNEPFVLTNNAVVTLTFKMTYKNK